MASRIAKNTKEKQVAREEALAEQSKLEQESVSFCALHTTTHTHTHTHTST